MLFSSESVEALVEQFTKLPTIGRKTARRLAAFVLKMPREEVLALSAALVAVKDRVQHCPICQNATDAIPCVLCKSDKRDHGLICVVEESGDVAVLERTGEYRGVYHVLGGVISPLDGIGPDDLKIRELISRVAGPQEANGEDARAIHEVILAVNPTVEGDTTAYYITQLLGPFGIRVTRLARGIPVGGDLSHADEATLSRALEGRNVVA